MVVEVLEVGNVATLIVARSIRGASLVDEAGVDGLLLGDLVG